MKKALIIAAAAFLLLTAALYIGDYLRNDPISCPAESKVESVFVASKDGKEKEVDEKHYNTLILGIKSAVPTMKDSVNDSPYEEAYFTLNVNTEKEQYRYYVYKKDSRYYIEKPYEGIYKIQEVIYLFLSEQLDVQ